jgi:ABC-2 type transport system permease protein
MAEGVVYDLGYRPHEGERLGRPGALRALYRDGLRRVLGLRRRARSKVLPWGLLGIAVLPATFFIGMAVFTSQIGDIGEVDFFSHAQYFDLTGTIALLFIALAAGELLVPDRAHGVLQVYASRPLTTNDYLLGRAAALATVVFAFMYVPHLVLFLGRAWVSDEGFGSYVAGHNGDLWQTAVASLVYFAALAPLAFLFAAYSKRPALGAGAFIGVMAVSSPATRALVVEAGFDPFGLLALQQHPAVVKNWIMGVGSGHLVPQRAGFDPWVSLVAIIVLGVVAAVMVARRYRRSG